MIPVSSFDVLKFLSKIGIDIDELFLRETVETSSVEFEYVGEIEQYAEQNPVPQAHLEI